MQKGVLVTCPGQQPLLLKSLADTESESETEGYILEAEYQHANSLKTREKPKKLQKLHKMHSLASENKKKALKLGHGVTQSRLDTPVLFKVEEFFNQPEYHEPVLKHDPETEKIDEIKVLQAFVERKPEKKLIQRDPCFWMSMTDLVEHSKVILPRKAGVKYWIPPWLEKK